jgi:hypothetical protein
VQRERERERGESKGSLVQLYIFIFVGCKMLLNLASHSMRIAVMIYEFPFKNEVKMV